MNLKDKVAVVTGGASGLGLGVCEEFVEAGAKVAIFDLNEDLGGEVAAQFGNNAVFAKVDVVDEDSVTGGIRKTLDMFGRIDICINCAGVADAAKTVSKGAPASLGWFQKVVNINLIGTFNVLRLCAAEMIKNDPTDPDGDRGVIINTSSGAAYDGQMGQAAYSASKAGVIGMVLPIARDLARDGIRINAIAPGLFETPMVGGMPDKVRQQLTQGFLHPKRTGNPREFGQLCRHMVENPFMNAECIRFDAGLRMV
jgi:3-hydroxyacyl-CoA dehydrogenase / 3-hydroxy-2-methylbutyryl-CoA dehydrogenase